MSSPEHHQNSLASGMDAKHVLELRACILIQAEHEPDTCSIFCLLLAHIFAEAMLPDHPRKRKADDRNASPQMPTRKVFRGEPVEERRIPETPKQGREISWNLSQSSSSSSSTSARTSSTLLTLSQSSFSASSSRLPTRRFPLDQLQDAEYRQEPDGLERHEDVKKESYEKSEGDVKEESYEKSEGEARTFDVIDVMLMNKEHCCRKR